MNKKNIALVFIVLAALIAGLLIGNIIAYRNLQFGDKFAIGNWTNFGHFSRFDQLLQLIDRHYIDSIDIDELSDQAAAEMIAQLDPHSVFISAKDLEDVNSELGGSFSGIGVQFNIQNDTIMIISVISGGPSEKVGLVAGDRIVLVDDSVFTGRSITNEKVMKSLRGQAGTLVKLGIRRSNSKDLLEFTITRGQIPVKSIDISYMIEPGIGLIRVNKFGEQTYSEFLTAIASLRAQGALRFIIDLRENSGGFLDRAIMMINEFLPARQLIVYTEGKAYPRVNSYSDGTGSCINKPIVVLIDEFSASASEIFAGAIQDNDRGLVIGRRSFGKGLVQQQKVLFDGSAVRLTVARYYTPSGRSIQRPYVRGQSDEYNQDIWNRFLHGEFDNKDSIQFNDTLTYKTASGRTVFGGGGIMPDIFVPRDTAAFTPWFNRVNNFMHLHQFAFSFTDINRTELSKFRDWQSLEQHLDKQNLLSQFVTYTSQKGINPVQSEINRSSSLVLNRLKAFISRNILGDDGFYPILFKEDNTVKRAVKEIRNLGSSI